MERHVSRKPSFRDVCSPRPQCRSLLGRHILDTTQTAAHQTLHVFALSQHALIRVLQVR